MWRKYFRPLLCECEYDFCNKFHTCNILQIHILIGKKTEKNFLFVTVGSIAQPAAIYPHSLSLICLLQQEEVENRMKKLVGWYKDREIAYYLPLWAKLTQFGEKILHLLQVKIDSDSEKQTKQNKTLYFCCNSAET